MPKVKNEKEKEILIFSKFTLIFQIQGNTQVKKRQFTLTFCLSNLDNHITNAQIHFHFHSPQAIWQVLM